MESNKNKNEEEKDKKGKGNKKGERGKREKKEGEMRKRRGGKVEATSQVEKLNIKCRDSGRLWSFHSCITHSKD